MGDRADTVPGFMMQSENFFLKFITGLQCGVSSKLLEYETDWYEVMEIILSRLQDEQENKEKFEMIAGRDLEYWARVQPGGDALNLKISVVLEEKRYFQPPAGSRKTLRLVFNDRFSTQVLFHVRKKQFLRSLKDISAVAVADQISTEAHIALLSSDLPCSLIPHVSRAFNDCWTARYSRTRLVSCPPWCSCKSTVSSLRSSSATSILQPQPQELLQPPQPQQPPQPSTSEVSRVNRRLPRKSTRKTKANKASVEDKKKRKNKNSACEKCLRKAAKSKGKVSTKIYCRDKSLSSDSKKKSTDEIVVDSFVEGQKQETDQVLRKYKSQLKQLKSRLKSYLTVNVKRLGKTQENNEDHQSSSSRKSPRLSKLKERLLQFGQNKRPTQEENIFEPRTSPRSLKLSRKEAGGSGSRAAKQNKFTESKSRSVKRNLRNQVLEASSSRKKRRHS